jgi:hypothetical protein
MARIRTNPHAIHYITSPSWEMLVAAATGGVAHYFARYPETDLLAARNGDADTHMEDFGVRAMAVLFEIAEYHRTDMSFSTRTDNIPADHQPITPNQRNYEWPLTRLC